MRDLHFVRSIVPPLFFLVSFFFLSSCGDSSRLDKASEDMLEELDNYLSVRASYEMNKLEKIGILKQMAKNETSSYEQKYAIYSSLVDEFSAYNYDSTLVYIKKCRDIAFQNQDTKRVDESKIRLGFFYTTSGHYLEATETLFSELDSVKLDPSLVTPYYSALHRLSWELDQYYSNFSYSTEYSTRVIYYRHKLFELLDSTSFQHLDLEIDEFRSAGQYLKADSVSKILISKVPVGSHDYAKATYTQSLISNSLGDYSGQLMWLIRSAKSDILNSVKDYASLTTISSYLVEYQEVERAIQYIRISLQDALSFNDRLRPWQVALALPDIEKAYYEKQEHQKRATLTYMTVISLMSLVLCAGVVFFVSRSRKLAKAQLELRRMNDFFSANNKELEDANKKLYELNKEISESNTVKEEYIGLFLSILSDNIDKLKNYENNVRKKIKYGKVEELMQDLSRSNLIEEEMAAFYQTFDTAFLTLYPDFVSEFNSLLDDNGQIEPKKGELLNTELRIFALIRLGIDDSSKIAALLRYSVNTIYNYRAKVKNSAKCSRDNFEEIIKRIGEIKY